MLVEKNKSKKMNIHLNDFWFYVMLGGVISYFIPAVGVVLLFAIIIFFVYSFIKNRKKARGIYAI